FGSDIQQAAHAAKRFGHYILAAALAVVGALLVRWLQARRAAQAAQAAAAAAAANAAAGARADTDAR
ncbi:MAG TPA: hypothetical protein VIW03_01170, partial [Anaeromyxobacter sp.]